MTNEQTEKKQPKTVVNEFYAPCRKKRDAVPDEEGEVICPYFIRDRGQGIVYCECANFHFPDKLARREYVFHFCGHPTGYKDCPIKQAMDHFYDRKYALPGAAPAVGTGKTGAAVKK